MKNALVIFNYNAGRKQAVLYKKAIQKFLLKRCNKFKFITVEEVETVETDEYDTVIAVGGDGTVNKAAQIVIEKNKTLAIIPCGTANLLAAKLGIPANLKKSLQIIDKNSIKPIDVIDINGNKCLLRIGIGYDSDIICKTPQSLKNKFGYFAYFIAGIIFATRLKSKSYEIRYSTGSMIVEATCIIMANAANMWQNVVTVANKSQLDDGLIDVFILKAKNPFVFFFEFFRILIGIRKDSSRAKYFSTQSINIKNHWAACHIDGEKTKLKDDICVNIISKILRVYSSY